jgi:hypothetical protein
MSRMERHATKKAATPKVRRETRPGERPRLMSGTTILRGQAERGSVEGLGPFHARIAA